MSHPQQGGGFAGVATIVRIVRFGISGVAATGVHVVLATSLIAWLSASPVVANGIAFVCAAVFSYLLNTLWSFSAPLRGDNLARFLCVSVLGLGVTLAISWSAQAMGASYWTGLACILTAVPPLTFILHRTWTYR